MNYSVLTDIIKLLPEYVLVQLTDDAGAGVVDQAKITEAGKQADAEIDSDCGTVYSVPFTTVPEIIKKISVDFTIYNLYSRRVEEIPQTRTDRYRNGKKQLRDIVNGLISLGDSPVQESSSDFVTGVLITSHFV